jgi:hypothetical protein
VAQNAETLEEHNPNDSAEDLRKVIERQEQEADRLENVRACCDGKSLSSQVVVVILPPVGYEEFLVY